MEWEITQVSRNKQARINGIVEYFADASEEELNKWMEQLEAVISGDLNEL